MAVDDVRALSPGLSGAAVYLVQARVTDTAMNAVLKIPDEAAPTLIAPRDALVGEREVAFYESALAQILTAGLRPARLLGVDRSGPGTWLWVEDVTAALKVRWSAEHAVRAAAAAAGLHRLFRVDRARIEALPWLERAGYAAHAHHTEQAHRNLDRLGADARWSSLFGGEERARLHRALDLTPWAVEEMAKLPVTLVHGDFHPGNLGFDDGKVVAIDWAHVGLAPIGCDVATLVSLAEAFGGAPLGRAHVEHAVVSAYVEALIAGGEPRSVAHEVWRACDLWHLTWGLHLRLGPGLTALLRHRDPDGPRAKREAADIRGGCRRAQRLLPRNRAAR